MISNNATGDSEQPCPASLRIAQALNSPDRPHGCLLHNVLSDGTRADPLLDEGYEFASVRSKEGIDGR